jgi:hypothetical protein
LFSLKGTSLADQLGLGLILHCKEGVSRARLVLSNAYNFYCLRRFSFFYRLTVIV